jgi:hypothetical protein
MSNTYTFPHVNVTSYAKIHAAAEAEESTATTMFAPFVSSKGPENTIVKVATYSDFVSMFGTLDFKDQGQMVLNIGQWLTGGGVVYAYRMTKAATSYTADLECKKEKNTSGATVFNYYAEVNDSSTSIQISGIGIGLKLHSESADAIPYLTYKIIESGSSSDTGIVAGSVGVKTTDDSYSTKLSALYVSLGESEGTTGETAASSTNYGVSQIKIRNSKYYLILNNESILRDTNVSVSDAISAKLAITTGTDVLVGGVDSGIKVLADGIKASGTCYDYITKAARKDTITAKYSGTYYNGVSVRIIGTSDTAMTIYVYVNGSDYPVESYKGITKDTLYKVSDASDYVGAIKLDSTTGITTSLSIKADLSGGTDISYSEDLMISAVEEGLKSRLETPVDVFLDPGYSFDSKIRLIDEFCGTTDTTAPRDDVTLVLSEYAYDLTDGSMKDAMSSFSWPTSYDGVIMDYTNCSMYDQYLVVVDKYSASQGSEVYVTPTYFLANLLPYNDAVYGLQWPTAGLSRGVLPNSDVKAINAVLSNAEKQSDFDSAINYIEKDSRHYAFMCQRTGVQDNTALQYLNNARVLKRMARELDSLARGYLHEFLDAETIQIVNKTLNNYVANWVSNRTLTYGNVSVAAEGDNALGIDLDVKFAGTIELINVRIVVE